LEVRPDGRAPRTEAGARRRPDPYAEAPFPASRRWPRVSVVVCTYNGARTIRDCLDGLVDLDYPDFEVIVTRIGYRSTWRCADARSSGLRSGARAGSPPTCPPLRYGSSGTSGSA